VKELKRVIGRLFGSRESRVDVWFNNKPLPDRIIPKSYKLN